MCCSVCLFIVVLALEKHSIPSVLAHDASHRGNEFTVKSLFLFCVKISARFIVLIMIFI